MHIPRAHVARRTERRILLGSTPGDDQIAIDRRRRAEAVGSRQTAKNLRRVQINASVIAKRWIWVAGLRVERIQAATVTAKHNLRRRRRIAGPVLDAAR